MPVMKKRGTHQDPTAIRTFPEIEDYWEEGTTRRTYSIPHSDGTFFSDGSGYSNGPVADAHYEVIERLRETVLRLEQIDLTELAKVDTTANSNFIPHVTEIEDDIRLTRAAMAQLDAEDVSDSILNEWVATFRHITNKYITRAAGICGVFLDNAAAEAGKEFGKVVGKFGGIALMLYLCGVDFHGVTTAIIALLQLRNS